VAGERNTLIYRFDDDNIEYRAVVIDMTDKANNAANLLGEAEYLVPGRKEGAGRPSRALRFPVRAQADDRSARRCRENDGGRCSVS
jgi:hypothetical protein